MMVKNGIDLVILDMDGTIVQYEQSTFHSSWDAIGHAAGLQEEWDKLTEFYYPKAKDPVMYRQWFDKNCEMLKGKEIASIAEKIFPPPITAGYEEFCTYLQQRGKVVGIVSGGVDLVGNYLQRSGSLAFVVCNVLHVEEGKFTGTGEMVSNHTGKGELVRKVCANYGVPPQRAAYIGDHENDIPAWKEVGLPLGMNVKREACHAAIQKNFGDFKEALDYFKRMGGN